MAALSKKKHDKTDLPVLSCPSIGLNQYISDILR